MIIGFIGFGKVAQNIVKLINSNEIRFITSAENRSKKTLENIEKSGIEILDTFRQVALSSDILISAASPKSALAIAEKYAGITNGIYLDLNNISPTTTLKIRQYADKFVDGAIIGKIDSDNPFLYLSGENAGELLFLNDYIQTRVISDKAGDASKLKMLRSTYTKTLSALLIESYDIAKDNDLEDEFYEILTLTEGDDFKEKSQSRIKIP